MYILIQPGSRADFFGNCYHIQSLSGADFQDENYMVHFEEQAEEVDFTVTIFDDGIAECPEEFFLDLIIPPLADRMGVIKGDLSIAKVVINDTDCEFTTIHCAPLNVGNTFSDQWPQQRTA